MAKQKIAPPWTAWAEKFERIVVAALALLLVLIVATILAVVAYLFITKLWTVTTVDKISDIQQMALRAFSGILLVLLGLELLDTVKVYFKEHAVRVEVILLVGLIAMGREVLEVDLYHVEPLVLLGFSGILLAFAVSYFLIRRAQPIVKESGAREQGNDPNAKNSSEKNR